MKKILPVAALAALAACAGNGQGRPALAGKGQLAPELSLHKLINAPVRELRGLDQLKGSVVVLEFWATWCGPCTDGLPEHNALAGRFRGEPVVFIHITDESESDVARFLEASRIDGWVAPEAGAAAFKSFRVYSRPHTVLIGKDGRVADILNGAPEAGAIMELLARRADSPAEGPCPQAGGPGALGEFHIAKSAGSGGTAQYGPSSLSASAMSLEYALEWVFGRVDRFDVDPSAAAEMAAAYDIRLRLPVASSGSARKFLLSALEESLGLKIVKKETLSEVYVLRRAPGGLVNVKERRDYVGTGMEGAVMRVNGASFSVLASRLGEMLGQPVLDETGGQGLYEYSFELDTEDPDALDARLRKKLGLRLSRLPRKITVVSVSRRAAK